MTNTNTSKVSKTIIQELEIVVCYAGDRMSSYQSLAIEIKGTAAQARALHMEYIVYKDATKNRYSVKDFIEKGFSEVLCDIGLNQSR